MRQLLTLSLALLMSAFLSACDNDPTGAERFTLDELSGSLDATRLQFTSNADPNQRVDLVSEGGRLSLQIDREGRFFETFFNPRTGVTETRTGTAQLRGSELVLQDDGAATPRIFVLRRNDSDSFRLTRTNDRFDFGTGSLQPATFEADLRRRP